MSRSSDCEKIIRRYSGKVDERKSDEQSTPSSEVLAKRESPREELRRTFALNNSVEDFIESPTDTMAEQTPNIMIFREVAEPSNKVGDMYELSWEGKKTVVVNFDFKICGYLGMPKLRVDIDDPTKGKVILGDGREIEAKIERLPKEDV